MKKLLFLAALAALTSCQLMDIAVGNGQSSSTSIKLEGFDSISLRCHLEVIYTQTSGEQGVTLTCDENLTDCYRIIVENGTLVVDTRNNTILKPKVKSYVTVNSSGVDGVSVSGSGSCRITGPLTSDGDIRFKVSGSGGIRAEGTVECREFSSTVSGSGSIGIAGLLADAASFRGSGSGSTSVDLLTADKVSATVSGSGSVRLFCQDVGDIDVSISGSGGVRLSGNARSLNSHTSGSGRVDSKNLSLGK